MIDGMFKDTMVNMNWTQIREYADKNTLVLIPIGVIEEHGPHLCLGTDIYTAHIQCSYIKEKLEEMGIEAIIAPPFYFGVCQSTGSFIGSFRVRKETATALLYDIISSLAEFGFKNIFGINAHGDIEQNIAILEAFKEATEKLKLNSRYAFPANLLQHYGLSGEEPYLCPIEPQTIQVGSTKYPDVHGGDIETAIINHFYPNLVDVKKSKSLPPVTVGDDKIMTWLFGGHTEELSPEGYLGSPADYEEVNVEEHLRDIAHRVSK